MAIENTKNDNKLLNVLLGVSVLYLLWEIFADDDDNLISEKGKQVLNNPNLKSEVDKKIVSLNSNSGQDIPNPQNKGKRVVIDF